MRGLVFLSRLCFQVKKKSFMAAHSFNLQLNIHYCLDITAIYPLSHHLEIMDGRHQSSMRRRDVCRETLDVCFDVPWWPCWMFTPAPVVPHCAIWRLFWTHIRKRWGTSKQTSLMIYSLRFGVFFSSRMNKDR